MREIKRLSPDHTHFHECVLNCRKMEGDAPGVRRKRSVRLVEKVGTAN
jgi:hypothetical protein